MKIVADRQIAHVQQVFSTIGDVILTDGREINSCAVQDKDILLVRSVTNVNADLLDESQVRFVATATSGIDHIDIDFLNKHNIGFTYAPGCNARSVAEYILSCLFVMADQQGFVLQDKVVGIIGCGEVGSRVLNFLEILGVESIVCDPPLKDKTGNSLYRDLDEIIDADIITLHVPLTGTGPYPTRHLLDKEFFSRIKKNCILINTSRGEVIDEEALKNTINNIRSFSVLLDVWSNEPAIDIELLAHVIVGTPHIAGYSIDSKNRATGMIYKAACRFFGLKTDRVLFNGPDNIGKRELKISPELNDNDAIQIAVLSHYDVRSDSASLRRILEINKKQHRQYFDELRKNYFVRREFSSTEINVAEGKEKLTNTFNRLGFMVKKS